MRGDGDSITQSSTSASYPLPLRERAWVRGKIILQAVALLVAGWGGLWLMWALWCAIGGE